MPTMPFEFLDLPKTRSTSKPRKTGKTMMIDMGLAPGLARDHLEVAGPYVDIAKIFVGSARLYDEDVLRRKMDVYATAGVDVFIGGQFVEYVIVRHGMDTIPRFMAEVARLGVQSIEVSDNCVPLSDTQRLELIKAGLDAGLEVHGEVGSKDTASGVGELIRQAEGMIAAGCDMVLFEAAEMVENGEADVEMISTIKSAIPAEQVMIELPGPWIRGVTLNDVYEMMKLTLGIFGPDANIGNVAWDQVINLESTRCGIGIAGPDYLDA